MEKAGKHDMRQLYTLCDEAESKELCQLSHFHSVIDPSTRHGDTHSVRLFSSESPLLNFSEDTFGDT